MMGIRRDPLLLKSLVFFEQNVVQYSIKYIVKMIFEV